MEGLQCCTRVYTKQNIHLPYVASCNFERTSDECWDWIKTLHYGNPSPSWTIKNGYINRGKILCVGERSGVIRHSIPEISRRTQREKKETEKQTDRDKHTQSIHINIRDLSWWFLNMQAEGWPETMQFLSGLTSIEL